MYGFYIAFYANVGLIIHDCYRIGNAAILFMLLKKQIHNLFPRFYSEVYCGGLKPYRIRTTMPVKVHKYKSLTKVGMLPNGLFGVLGGVILGLTLLTCLNFEIA